MTGRDGHTDDRARIAMSVIIVAAAALRFTALSSQSLWLDEMTSITVAQKPLADIIAGKGFDKHTPPFYYVLLHLWLQLGGGSVSEALLRSFSAVCDLFVVLTLYLIVSPYFGARRAVAAAALYAVSPFAVYYAQEGRMYPLAAALGSATIAVALRAWTGPLAAWQRVSLVMLVACGLYTHYYYAFLVASLSAFIVLAGWRDRARVRRWLVPVIIGGLCFLPWIGVVMSLAAQGGQPFRRFVFSVPFYALLRFAAGYAVMPINAGAKDDIMKTVSAHAPVIILCCGMAAFWLLRGIQNARAVHRDATALLAAALFGPLAIALVISLRAPLLSERYLSIVYPIFLFFVACGAPRPRRLPFLLFAFCLLRYYTAENFGFAQWRDAGQIASSVDGAPILVNPPFAGDVLSYYLPAGRRALPVPRDPAELASSLARTLGPLPPRTVLVEGLEAPSVRDAIAARGYRGTVEILLPHENGIRVVIFERAA